MKQEMLSPAYTTRWKSCQLPVSDRRNDRQDLPQELTLPIIQMTCLQGTMTNIILCDADYQHQRT